MGTKFKTTINIDRSYTLTAYEPHLRDESVYWRTNYHSLSKILKLEIKQSRDEWLLSLFKLQEYYSAVESDSAGGKQYDLFVLEKVYLENETATYTDKIVSHKSYVSALYELLEIGHSLSSGDQGGFIWTYDSSGSPEFTLHSESYIYNRDFYLTKRVSRKYFIVLKDSYISGTDGSPKRDRVGDRYIPGSPVILRDSSSGQFGSYPSFEGDDEED